MLVCQVLSILNNKKYYTSLIYPLKSIVVTVCSTQLFEKSMKNIFKYNSTHGCHIGMGGSLKKSDALNCPCLFVYWKRISDCKSILE